MKCRHCEAQLEHVFADLETSPPSNAYLTAQDLSHSETYFPLRVLVCENCWLVQTEDYSRPEAFFTADYAYFSSYSTSWLAHSRAYVAAIIERFKLGHGSLVVEVAANDGYLLQFVKAAGIPCLGIEPTADTAVAARAKGIDIVERFFGLVLADELVESGRQADLIAANNVLAHVPMINDFVAGFARLLKTEGVATFEFPHLLELVRHCQFDTIYHEHFSYFSLLTVERIFRANGLRIFDVERIPTHGGSIRIYACLEDAVTHLRRDAVDLLKAEELSAGMAGMEFYQGFQSRVLGVKNSLVNLLLQARSQGHKVAAYGAAAKGNTLLNFAGIRRDLLPYVVDRNPMKQGKYLPGSRIPIVAEEHLESDRPDIVIILPWNLTAEIAAQLNYVHAWGGRLIRVVPEVETVGL